jgi:hypothetical protein
MHRRERQHREGGREEDCHKDKHRETQVEMNPREREREGGKKRCESQDRGPGLVTYVKNYTNILYCSLLRI